MGLRGAFNDLLNNAPRCMKGLAGWCARLVNGRAVLSGRTAEEGGAPIATGAGTPEMPVRAVNKGTIVVDGTDDRALFDYYKADLSQMDSRSNRSLSAFAMASLAPDPHGERYREAADRAVLTNDGEIRMNMGGLLRRYGPEMTAPGDMEALPGGKQGIREGSGKKYLSIMLWGMLGGCETTLVNNGSIVTECDTDDPEGTQSVFTHPMYVYHRSAMINNGEVLVRGVGNRGINPRGLTSQKHDLTVVNNGSIVIDVQNAYLTRALTVAGFGSAIANRGRVFARSGGTVFGAGHTGSSTLINAGVVDVTTMGVVPRERIGVLSTFSALPGAYGLSAAGPDFMLEKLHDKLGVRNWKGGGIVNTGVVRAAVRDAGAADPKCAAAGILLMDAHMPYNGWYTVSNPGLIRVASDLKPCAENGHRVRCAELVVNCVHMPEKTYPARIRVRDWATELRDFGAAGDLIQARSDSDEPIELNFQEASLILRPPEDYAAGTPVTVNAQALVTPIGAPTLQEAGVRVTDMEYLRFGTEMPDFLAADVTETAPGDYRVSLRLAEEPLAQRNLLATAALGPVDFIRLNMEELDRMLGGGELLSWSGGAYQFAHSRKGGLKGQIQGVSGAKDLGLGPLFQAGVHGAVARGRASGDFCSANSRMSAAMEGAHLYILGGALRAQVTRFDTTGGTDLALHTNTGVRLDGRADGKLNGLYASAHLGGQVPLGINGRLYAEAGVTRLRFNRGARVDWRLGDEALPGYRMQTDPVRNVRWRFRMGFRYLLGGGRNGQVSFSLAGSGALSDAGTGLDMLKERFGERVREDPIQVFADASIQLRIAGLNLNMSFHGGLGKNTRQARLRVSLRP